MSSLKETLHKEAKKCKNQKLYSLLVEAGDKISRLEHDLTKTVKLRKKEVERLKLMNLMEEQNEHLVDAVFLITNGLKKAQQSIESVTFEKMPGKTMFENAAKDELKEIISMLRKSASSGEGEYYFLPRCDKSDVESWCRVIGFNIEDIPIDGE